MSHGSRARERRKTLPPSDALLARVCAVIDLLIDSGLSEEVATQTMLQRMREAGVPLDTEICLRSIEDWRAAFRNGAANEDARREYQNILAAIESLPPDERLERVLGNELWDRRRLDLHGSSARKCLVY
jgi:hypothetical protein